ncbi:hypothetical protein EVAR_43181_1 [Eumeta japonica]|uniref:Uncharacterized protein n=1 Tax=Eumeta variegata TaxID=151549 RepID=A0A4C1XP99_EUMVA|nr:hypothetical protein EVAR_43181_1 [Eumeta japonica]
MLQKVVLLNLVIVRCGSVGGLSGSSLPGRVEKKNHFSLLIIHQIIANPIPRRKMSADYKVEMIKNDLFHVRGRLPVLNAPTVPQLVMMRLCDTTLRSTLRVIAREEIGH